MRISDWSSDVCSSDLRRWTVAGQVCGHESARTLERGNIETGNRRAAYAARIEFSQVAHTRHQIDGHAVSTRRTRFRMVGDQPQRAVIAHETHRIFAKLPGADNSTAAHIVGKELVSTY